MANPDYSRMSHDEFEWCLSQILSKYSAIDLFSIMPDIQNEVMEYFNNDILDLWANHYGKDKED